MLITQLKVSHDEDKYNEYLAKVERVKFEMADKYRLHPSNYITKKHDIIGNYHLHGNYRRSRAPLVIIDDLGWDETRIDTIGSNGDGFPGVSHYEHI